MSQYLRIALYLDEVMMPLHMNVVPIVPIVVVDDSDPKIFKDRSSKYVSFDGKLDT